MLYGYLYACGNLCYFYLLVTLAKQFQNYVQNGKHAHPASNIGKKVHSIYKRQQTKILKTLRI